jgi:hypothetical protein
MAGATAAEGIVEAEERVLAAIRRGRSAATLLEETAVSAPVAPAG